MASATIRTKDGSGCKLDGTAQSDHCGGERGRQRSRSAGAASSCCWGRGAVAT
jgi:hypothetical protein